MAEKLAVTVESLDSVPEAVRGFYEEADGKFRLAVDGIRTEQDIQGLKSALDKEREARKALEKRTKSLPEDFDADEWQRLRQDAEERAQREAERKGEWDKLAKQMADKHEQALAKKAQEMEGLRSRLDTVLRENAARDALEKADAFVHIALPHVLARTEMRDIDGELRAVVLNEAGEPRVDDNGKFLTIDALVKEMSEQDEWAALFKAPDASGGGAGGRGGARGAGSKAFNKMSETEKMDYMDALVERHGLAEAKRLYSEAVRGAAA